MQLSTSTFSPTIHPLWSKTVEDTRKEKKTQQKLKMGITLVNVITHAGTDS